jgi:anti-anti-sigma factor
MISRAPAEPDANHPHIAYTFDERKHPRVVIVEFLSHAIADPTHGAELSNQLSALIRPDLPSCYVLDLEGVRSLSSTAFGALLSFILKVRHAEGQVAMCNVDEFVRVGAEILRIGDFARFASDRRSAIAAVIEESV